jgi:hypothetical protein
MDTIDGSFLPANGEHDETQLPLAPVPGVLAEVFRTLPGYGGPRDAARDYLRDSIELGLEHLAGACSAWGSRAYFPCEASCRTAFEISVNVLYMLQAPDQRSYQHQRASIIDQQKRLKTALKLAGQQGLAELAKEVSYNLEMLHGQMEIVEGLAPVVADRSAKSTDSWPNMRERLVAVDEELDYETLYSVLCRSTHGNAEPLIERRLARVVAHGGARGNDMTHALLVHFRETTRAFSRMMIAHASFRLMKVAGHFANRYGIRPLLKTALDNLDPVRLLGYEAAAEVRTLRESDAWKDA